MSFQFVFTVNSETTVSHNISSIIIYSFVHYNFIKCCLKPSLCVSNIVSTRYWPFTIIASFLSRESLIACH